MGKQIAGQKEKVLEDNKGNALDKEGRSPRIPEHRL